MQNSTWTIIFEDKKIVKSSGDMASTPTGYKILDDDAFWNQSKFSNIWAIQHGTSVTSDEVEYRDATPHSSFADANIGDISQFSNKWDTKYLAKIQTDWDNNILYDSDNNVVSETNEEKITRLGARPTSYTSS